MAKKSNVLPILLGGGLLAAIVFAGSSSAKASGLPATPKPPTPKPPTPGPSPAPKPPVVIGTQPGNANVQQGSTGGGGGSGVTDTISNALDQAWNAYNNLPPGSSTPDFSNIGTSPGNANVAQGTWDNTPPSDQSAGP